MICKSYMKIIISFISFFGLILSLIPVQIFAKEATSDDKIQAFVLKYDDLRILDMVKDDLNKLNALGFCKENIFPVDVVGGRIVYEVDFDTVTNQITIEKTAVGDLIINFYEDDKHDVLMIAESGNMQINGYSIVYDSTFEDSAGETGDLKQPIGVITSTQARYDYYSKKPIKNKSTYTIYLGEYASNIISWGVSTIVGMTVGAIATIITTAFNAPLGLSIFVSCATSLASAMLTRAEIYGMDDAYWSFKLKKYESTSSNSLDRNYMYTGNCYSKRNYKGTSFSHTFYYQNYFS